MLRHVIKLTGLEPNTRYYYQVGVPDNGTSEVMSFFTKEGNPVFAVSSTDVMSRFIIQLPYPETNSRCQGVSKKICL